MYFKFSSLYYKPLLLLEHVKLTITNAADLQKYKSTFSLIVKQILAFSSSKNLAREVNLNFKQIKFQCFTLLKILIQIIRSITSLNFNQFLETCYSPEAWVKLIRLTSLPLFCRHFSFEREKPLALILCD